MDIIISNTDKAPIYEQIIMQIKEMIINGILKEGDALPSMRLLAKELRISIITTKRAYEELEREGFIESYTGRGSFVKSTNREIFREEGLKQIEENLQIACEKAKLFDISKQELVELIDILYGSESEE